jgi:hypothetical protein
MQNIRSFRELRVWLKGMELAMEIFVLGRLVTMAAHPEQSSIR